MLAENNIILQNAWLDTPILSFLNHLSYLKEKNDLSAPKSGKTY